MGRSYTFRLGRRPGRWFGWIGKGGLEEHLTTFGRFGILAFRRTGHAWRFRRPMLTESGYTTLAAAVELDWRRRWAQRARYGRPMPSASRYRGGLTGFRACSWRPQTEAPNPSRCATAKARPSNRGPWIGRRTVASCW